MTIGPDDAQRDAVDRVVERVRGLLRRDGVDPQRASEETRRLAWAEARRHNDQALARGGDTIDEAACVSEVVASVAGYGPLQAYLDDPEVEEVWINSPAHVFVARGGVSERTALRLTEEQVRDLVERMLHATGRRVDVSQPFVDASLPDGSRLHVAIGGVTRRHWAVNIRKFHAHYRSLAALVESGSLTGAAADYLSAAVADGASILVSGATQAGKTTMLSALLSASPSDRRIITVEETFELAIDATDIVSMQGRQPSLEGTSKHCCIRCHIRSRRYLPAIPGFSRHAEGA